MIQVAAYAHSSVCHTKTASEAAFGGLRQKCLKQAADCVTQNSENVCWKFETLTFNSQIHEECHYMSHIVLCVATLNANDKALPDGNCPVLLFFIFRTLLHPWLPLLCLRAFGACPFSSSLLVGIVYIYYVPLFLWGNSWPPLLAVL